MSSKPAAEIKIAEPLPVYMPARPAPLIIKDVRFRQCGQDVCLTPAEAKTEIRNKVAVGKWMGEMNHIVDYYESTVKKDQRPQTSPDPSLYK